MFNRQIKQILILSVIISLAFIVARELYIFLPGLLGALTLYILSRKTNFNLVYKRRWKKGLAAGFIIFCFIILIVLPIYLAIALLSPKINAFLDDPSAMISAAKHSIVTIQEKLGMNLFTEASLTSSLSKLTSAIPSILNDTVNLITNLAIMLFILYYMLYHGNDIERMLNRLIPLKQENIDVLANETIIMVRANALGIPLISIIQGITATIGYFIFGVNEWALWGFLTGVFAFFPVVGTMIIWVPIVIYVYAIGQTWQGTGLLIYSLIVTGNIDYLSRVTLLKKLGNVHPVVTIFGVIVGLSLFGFIGLVFGPLLISYIVLLFKIYMNEFIEVPAPQARAMTHEESDEDVGADE